jgi:ATP-dependent Lon protease
MHNTGAATALTLCSFISFCSGLMDKLVQSHMVCLGDMSLDGNIIPTTNLSETLQPAFDSGAKRILITTSSVRRHYNNTWGIFAKFQTSLYSDPVDSKFKDLGVE